MEGAALQLSAAGPRGRHRRRRGGRGRRGLRSDGPLEVRHRRDRGLADALRPRARLPAPGGPLAGCDEPVAHSWARAHWVGRLAGDRGDRCCPHSRVDPRRDRDAVVTRRNRARGTRVPAAPAGPGPEPWPDAGA